jgi:hypothetical protein
MRDSPNGRRRTDGRGRPAPVFRRLQEQPSVGHMNGEAARRVPAGRRIAGFDLRDPPRSDDLASLWHLHPAVAGRHRMIGARQSAPAGSPPEAKANERVHCFRRRPGRRLAGLPRPCGRGSFLQDSLDLQDRNGRSEAEDDECGQKQGASWNERLRIHCRPRRPDFARCGSSLNGSLSTTKCAQLASGATEASARAAMVRWVVVFGLTAAATGR